ncbi:hypothetical protein D9757_009558 [Collybiopsis confluens]|uniref:FHA domain-containing protein n=1 Tax=Collybiopsis confluens TaxID=2823264 RepID=A0A8H5H918_9AGAR|nr:hypothetical protein D9757_009558 [Collybiopsis confluens]
MLDDDIQFLGVSNTTSKPRAIHPSANSVTGFALHIEKNGNEAGFRMMFPKVNTNTVVVGRKPPGTVSYESDNSKAMFRCPVVSRSHAKFTFTDSGLLYLIDTSSHHGTFVRQPHELTAKAIPAETPVQVHNGDVVTFGKSVGRNNEVVRPIVARVEMINHTFDATSRTSTRMTTSGRYGLRVHNTSEDDSSHSESSSDGNVSPSGSSDHESDIVEIAPPPPRTSVSTVIPSVNRAIRSLILPTDAPLAPIDSVSPSSSPFRIYDDPISYGRPKTFKDLFDFNTIMDFTEDLDSPAFPNKRNFHEGGLSTSSMDLATPSPQSSPRSSPFRALVPAHGPIDKGSTSSQPSPLALDDFSFSPEKVKEPVPQSSSSSMSLNDILHPPEPAVDLVSAAASFLSSFSTPSASGSGGSGEEEESPFAGHAEEEDAAFDLSLPDEPLADGTSTSAEVVPEGSANAVAGPSAVSVTIAHNDVAMESLIEPSNEEEDHQAMDEQVFNEVHYGAQDKLPAASVAVATLPPKSTESKIAEIRAAISLFKERLIGPSSPSTASGAVGTDGAAKASSPIITAAVAIPSGGPVEAGETFESANRKKIQEIEEINEELSSMKRNISSLQAHQRRYKFRFNSNVTTMTVKLDQLTALSTKVSDLQVVLDELKVKAEAHLDTACLSASDAADVEMLKTDIDIVRTDVEGVRLDVEEARSEMNVVRIDVDGMKTDMEIVQSDIDASRNDVESVRADVDSIRADVDVVRNEVDYVKDDYETVRGDVNGLQNDVAVVQSDVDGLRGEVGDVRRDVDDLMGGQGEGMLKGEMDDMKMDLGRLECAWDEWKMEMDVKVETDLRMLRPRLGEMKESIESLIVRMSVHDVKMKDLAESGRSNNVELQDLIDEVVKIQERTTAEFEAARAARAQAEDELRAIVGMREEAHAQSRLHAAAAQNETGATSSSSLKRKRADDCGDEDVGAERVNIIESEEINGVGPASTVSLSETDDGILVPAPKRARTARRARRVGTAVAQTATAITIGAVAAWTALAYS